MISHRNSGDIGSSLQSDSAGRPPLVSSQVAVAEPEASNVLESTKSMPSAGTRCDAGGDKTHTLHLACTPDAAAATLVKYDK
jgi:hypothetical protein